MGLAYLARRLAEAWQSRKQEAQHHGAERFRSWLSWLKSTKTYGRAKRWIWQASLATVPAVVTVVLAWLLHGR